MAVPKRKMSKARRDSRRAMKMPHRVCPECGYYNGKQVVAKDAE